MKNRLFPLVTLLVILAIPGACAQTSFLDLVKTASPRQVADALAQGADVNALDTNKMTPLMWAARANPDPEVITTLVKAGAVLEAKDLTYDSGGATALMHAAASNPNPAVITTLLKAGAALNARDTSGLTVLMYAAASNPNPAVITTLLKAGADVGARTGIQLNAVLLAAEHNANLDVLRALLAGGGEITPNANGVTPLIYAARTSRTPVVVSTLLTLGADARVTGAWGKTALDWARVNTSLKGTDALQRLIGASELTAP